MTDEERWRRTAARVHEGLKIDPDTAEVMWAYGAIMDPYDDVADFSEADRERTLVYFARRPGGNWVCFDHLPDESRDTLYYKYYHNFAGPRGFLKYQSSVDRCYSRLVLPSVSDAFIDVDVPF